MYEILILISPYSYVIHMQCTPEYTDMVVKKMHVGIYTFYYNSLLFRLHE